MSSLNIIIKTEPVTTQIRKFGCPVCSTFFDYKNEAEKHIAYEHSYTKKLNTNFGALFFFETEQSLDSFCTFSWISRTRDKFIPGWYVSEDEEDVVIPISVFKEKIESKYKEMLRLIAELAEGK